MSEILSKEQIRIILLHEFKLGRKAVEAHENIVKAWGPDVFSIRSTQLWFQKVKGDQKKKINQQTLEKIKVLGNYNELTKIR